MVFCQFLNACVGMFVLLYLVSRTGSVWGRSWPRASWLPTAEGDPTTAAPEGELALRTDEGRGNKDPTNYITSHYCGLEPEITSFIILMISTITTRVGYSYCSSFWRNFPENVSKTDQSQTCRSQSCETWKHDFIFPPITFTLLCTETLKPAEPQTSFCRGALTFYFYPLLQTLVWKN